MLMEIISFYGTVIGSFMLPPFQETGSLYAVGSALLGFITIFKEITK